MSNLGNFKLALKDITGADWQGVVEVRIIDRQDEVVFSKRGRYRSPITFQELAANPVAHYRIHVKPAFHVPASRFVTVQVDQTKEYDMRLMADWRIAAQNGREIAFPGSNELKGDLSPMGEAIARSPGQDVPEVKEEEVLPFPDGLAGYDSWIESGHHRLIACLHNLFAKMSVTDLKLEGGSDSDQQSVSAWNILDRVIAVRQDRLYALIKESYAKKMDSLLSWLKNSELFDNNPSGFHNVKAPEGYTKHDLTFKSNQPDYGTLQLSFSRNANRDSWALDADIDEKSGIGHLGEVLFHIVAGVRTSPYAVYELLRRQGLKPAYKLVLKPPPPG